MDQGDRLPESDAQFMPQECLMEDIPIDHSGPLFTNLKTDEGKFLLML